MLPSYEQMMLPVLKILKKQAAAMPLMEVSMPLSDIRRELIRQFNITEEEQNWVKDGRTPLFQASTRWAIWYLREAGLLLAKNSEFSLSEVGNLVLEKHPERITLGFLKKLNSPQTAAEFELFVDDDALNAKTPEELIGIGFEQIKYRVKIELLNRIKSCSPAFFERLVVRLLERMGYGRGETSRLSKDGGIDGIIYQDKLGLERIYVQAKRWKDIVGSPQIDSFVGALKKHHAKKGVFITTGVYSKDAREVVRNLDDAVILIEGQELAAYMIEYKLGVNSKQVFEIPDIDNDFFNEEEI